MDLLSWSRYDAGRAVVLTLHGPLTADCGPQLERALALLLVELRRPLVLDLTGITASDPAGLAILGAVARAAPPATPLRLAPSAFQRASSSSSRTSARQSAAAARRSATSLPVRS